MAKKKTIEDAILIKLLSIEKEDFYWQKVFEVLRNPILDLLLFIDPNNYLSVNDRLIVFSKSLAYLKIIAEDLSKKEEKKHSFLGALLEKIAQVVESDYRIIVDEKKLINIFTEVYPYLASDSLLNILLEEQREFAYNITYNRFRIPACERMNSKFKFQNNDAEDDYSETMLTFKNKLEDKKVKPPLTSLVLSYVCGIFFNVIRNRLKKDKRSPIQHMDIQEYAHLIEVERTDSGYEDELAFKFPKIKQLNFENISELSEQIMKELPDEKKEILRQKFIDNQKYKEIGRQIGKKENAVRQIVYQTKLQLFKKFNLKNPKKTIIYEKKSS